MARKGGTPENLIPAKKGEVRNPHGAPLRLVSVLNKELKERGFEVVTKNHIIDAFQTLLNLPLSQITEIAKKDNDEYPILYKLVAKELIGNRGHEALERLLDRAFGRPSQSIAMDHSGELKQIVVVRDKETAAEIEKLS